MANFIEINNSTNLTGVGGYDSWMSWGDFDGDSNLDLLALGEDDSGTRVAKIYNNDG